MPLIFTISIQISVVDYYAKIAKPSYVIPLIYLEFC